MYKHQFYVCLAILLFIVGCSSAPVAEGPEVDSSGQLAEEEPADTITEADQESAPAPDVEYTLRTGGGEGSLAFIGVGGDIDGVTNPTLNALPGDVVKITLVNADGILHDISIEEFNIKSDDVQTQGETASITFTVESEGEYIYFCSIPGHRQAGMFGSLIVGTPQAEAAFGESIILNPADLPGPVGDRDPELVRIDLTAEEVVGQLADGATYRYFTFNGKVPGPFVRARVGDTVEINLTNDMSSTLAHSIDLHAVNGPGGGAVYTQTPPGETYSFTFKALNPGLYVYHCATPSVPHHIASGMYGLILIEPEGGLPEVDKEFYVMQGEIYTVEPFGSQGELSFSMDKMLAESPEYFVFNGAAAGLAGDDNVLRANVGDTVRIYMGVGGPNFTSSFHVIGEIFDRVYPYASLTSEPLTDVQTVSVPPGGAWVVEFTIDVPGRYILVDHALSRLERGLVGFLIAEGDDDPEIFKEGPAE